MPSGVSFKLVGQEKKA